MDVFWVRITRQSYDFKKAFISMLMILMTKSYPTATNMWGLSMIT